MPHPEMEVMWFQLDTFIVAQFYIQKHEEVSSHLSDLDPDPSSR